MSSKAAAANWADERVRSGVTVVARNRNIHLDAYAKAFWDFGNPEYIKGRIARGGTISRGYADICSGYVKNISAFAPARRVRNHTIMSPGNPGRFTRTCRFYSS